MNLRASRPRGDHPLFCGAHDGPDVDLSLLCRKLTTDWLALRCEAVRFRAGYWENVSEEARDVCRRLLARDPGMKSFSEFPQYAERLAMVLKGLCAGRSGSHRLPCLG